MEKGFCQAHTPSPLGKDRERFLELINEIQEQKSTNAEQFSNLTLAQLSEENQKGEQSHRSIMAGLTKGAFIQKDEESESQKAERLWNARLVLALAEILDKEEAELAESFSDIDSSEMDIFQALKGEMDAEGTMEEDDPFAQLTRIRAKLSQQRPGTIKRRWQAWKTLYISGTISEEFWLWITGNEEAGEILISEYETVSGRNSAPLLRLNIPVQMVLRDKDALESILHFREKAGAIRKRITEKLHGTVKQKHLDLVDPVALLPDAGVLARDWNDLIEYYFPESKFGRKILDLQFLANFSFKQLLHQKTETKGYCHSILAICRE
ncbi:MAG: hypothetical protein DSY80_06825 [Desulfocapsa sp.]|nr:MAG: hypothetical protein DSY80_06825 [Desulfocapsa sp.]